MANDCMGTLSSLSTLSRPSLQIPPRKSERARQGGWPGGGEKTKEGREGAEEKILTDQVRRQTQTRSGPWKMFQTANTQHAPYARLSVVCRLEGRSEGKD
ncbi:hypothetical protein CDAR_589441 [Caerostris darwini]|uniref:Uncharacterized protein n=1 Tax=Caerostris darwini TaxID=1538125 RepID=A0AAV4TA27_9ARAC|nr:hypothetical protein CDAR_589441 [Caerostris darwini]